MCVYLWGEREELEFELWKVLLIIWFEGKFLCGEVVVGGVFVVVCVVGFMVELCLRFI